MTKEKCVPAFVSRTASEHDFSFGAHRLSSLLRAPKMQQRIQQGLKDTDFFFEKILKIETAAMQGKVRN